MVDFKQATKWLKEGKKIKRPDFDDGEYISLFDGTIPKFINTNNDNQKEYFNFDVLDFEAIDWEIYEEEDNWNLLKHSYEIGLNNQLQKCENSDKFILSDIKTLKEKMIKDIGELTRMRGINEKCKIHNAITTERERFIEIIKNRTGLKNDND